MKTWECRLRLQDEPTHGVIAPRPIPSSENVLLQMQGQDFVLARCAVPGGGCSYVPAVL